MIAFNNPSSLSGARPARVALLGCGTVGREVARRLTAPNEAGARPHARLVKVLVRDTGRERGVSPSLVTDRFDDVLAARPDVVIEVIGGLDPAGVFVEEALRRGVPVVSANKTLIAHRGERLLKTAERAGVVLAFEASVCAAVPVLAALGQLRGDRVLAIRGIVNGSCNFILTRMGAGLTMGEALGEARRRGLVEPDPSADLSGRDSAEKLCVLAAAAGFAGVTPDRVACTGIEGIAPEDIAAARRSGRVVKLLAELDASAGAPRLRVGPTLLSVRHPLAGIANEENGIVITAEHAGEILLRGKGAGPGPTASAVLSDVARLMERPALDRVASRGERAEERTVASRRHHIRVRGTGLTPERVFRALDERGVAAEEVALGRSGAAVTARIGAGDASELGRSLSGERGGKSVLVMPVV